MNENRLHAIYTSLEKFRDREYRDLPSKTVYVLDDDLDSCKLIRKLCERFFGIDTHIEIFQEEISLLKRTHFKHPDLVIIDYHLGYFKAPQVLKMLQAISLFDIKSLIISGDYSLKEMDNLVTKPISLNKFKRELEKAVA